MIIFYVDVDVCLVKDEVICVGEWYKVLIIFVFNSWMCLLEGDLIQRVVVFEGLDEVDNWIVEWVEMGDVVVIVDVLFVF